MGDRIASLNQLQEFNRTPEADRRVSAALRGVLAEIATTARLRYEWKELQPLIRFHIDSVLNDMEAESQVEVGPVRPMAGGASPAEFKTRLGALLQAHEDGTPFTVQRLCEVLLEPRKQYSQFEALALAIEKLLLVQTLVDKTPEASLPPLPLLSELPAVNETPARHLQNGPQSLSNSHHVQT